MSDRDEMTESQEAATEARESADRLRRQLVKAGAAAVPTIISLQSGTAWAISSCASRGVNEPTSAQVSAEFGLSSDPPSASQQGNRNLVTSVTGIPDSGAGSIDTIVSGATNTNAGNPFPEMGSVEDSDVIYLLVTNGSCWTSFCAGPVGNGDVTISGVSGTCT